ncbi:FkbM family methyltransferase [Rhizorhabdus argentea]|uniref:FkbM family methyltransferase n=1 Tax=Rhizorhabdus argentea TaxID=1387174 RepID=UPI0030EBFFF9
MDLGALKKSRRDHNEAVIRGMCANAYLGKGTSLCNVLGRYKMFVDTSDIGFSSHMLLDGYWEMWVTEAIVQRIAAGMVAVDCGANLGYFTLLMSDLVGPSGQVHAFEPNPAIAARLVNTVAINGFSDHTVVHGAALSDKSGEAVLFIPHGEPKNAFVDAAVVGDPQFESVAVPTLRLDELPNAEKIDFIKIDVEGAEERVWSGMQGILRSGRPLTIVLEFASSRYSDAGAFLREIMSHGFAFQIIDPIEGVFQTTIEGILARPARIDQMLILSR